MDGTKTGAKGVDIPKISQAKKRTDSMLSLFAMKLDRHCCIQKAVDTTGVIPDHGNTEKSTKILDIDPRSPPLHKHCEDLLKLGEVRATCFVFVQKMVEGTATMTVEDAPNDKKISPPPLDSVQCTISTCNLKATMSR